MKWSDGIRNSQKSFKLIPVNRNSVSQKNYRFSNFVDLFSNVFHRGCKLLVDYLHIKGLLADLPLLPVWHEGVKTCIYLISFGIHHRTDDLLNTIEIIGNAIDSWDGYNRLVKSKGKSLGCCTSYP